MPKKPKDKTLTDNIDKLWSKTVRYLNNGKCEVCGAKNNVQAHHIIGRGNWRLRWEIKNGIPLCSKHHKFDRHKSAHLNPLWFGEWLDEHHPDKVKWLKERQWITYSWKRHEKVDMLQEMKSLYKLQDKEKISNFEIAFNENYYLPRRHS